MAVVVFSGSDQQAEAKAVIATLSMWLRELPDQPPRPAKARFVYGTSGVARLIVEVEPPVDEPK
jgi:hypothetical protein